MKNKVDIYCILLTTLFIAGVNKVSVSQVGIGTTNPNPNAELTISSVNKGILIPRLNSQQINNVLDTTGLLLFNTDSNFFMVYIINKWYVLNPWKGNANSIHSIAPHVSIGFDSNQAALEVNGSLRLRPSGEPSEKLPGTMYFDSNLLRWLLWNGTNWVKIAMDSDMDGLIDGKDPDDSQANDFTADEADVVAGKKYWEGCVKTGTLEYHKNYYIPYDTNLFMQGDFVNLNFYADTISLDGCSSLKPENIKKGVTIFGINGNYE